MSIRPRPTPNLDLVFHPQHDGSYIHFDGAALHPFQPDPTVLGRRSAWWLADAALLTYWKPDDVVARYRSAGFEAEPVFAMPTQCYLAWTDRAVIVSFRGTEPGEPGDVFDDVGFALAPWDSAKSLVHLGFKLALNRVWPRLEARLAELSPSRSVWFSGHSLGAALATLAADRFAATAGVCTLGGPRVGNRRFALAHTRRFGPRSLRYANDADIVTHLPPPVPYEHAGTARFIDPDGRVSSRRPRLEHFFRPLIGNPAHVREMRQCLFDGRLKEAPDFLLDHMPRAYTVDLWNDYVGSGD
jgi:triacylglycerol lipase